MGLNLLEIVQSYELLNLLPLPIGTTYRPFDRYEPTATNALGRNNNKVRPQSAKQAPMFLKTRAKRSTEAMKVDTSPRAAAGAWEGCPDQRITPQVRLHELDGFLSREILAFSDSDHLAAIGMPTLLTQKTVSGATELDKSAPTDDRRDGGRRHCRCIAHKGWKDEAERLQVLHGVAG